MSEESRRDYTAIIAHQNIAGAEIIAHIVKTTMRQRAIHPGNDHKPGVVSGLDRSLSDAL
jgi:hypothetical protein